MNKQEKKRLERLQSDSEKEAGEAPKKLTLPDLMLLLQHDSKLRGLIFEIAASQGKGEEETSESHPAAPRKSTVEPEEASLLSPPPPAPVDLLRTQLANQLALLAAVRADETLAKDWLLPDGENEGQQLIRLIARISQWETVMDLWDLLANRCKQDKRAASSTELNILTMAVSVHNLRWQGRQAKICDAEIGSPFNFRHHQRGGTLTGETILAQWLPGLTNAGGEIQKTPLIQT